MRKSVVLVTVAGTLGVDDTAAKTENWGRPCTESQWLTIGASQSKIEAQGYTVRKVRLKKTCGEVYAADRGGARVELFVDRHGAIVGKP